MAGETTTGSVVGSPVGTESSLSNWAGPYVTDMLAKGQAQSNMPYQAYTGPLTAGSSGLQDTAFQGIAGLAMPGTTPPATPYAANTTTPNTFGTNDVNTTSFLDDNNASQYMNPYLQQVMAPQYREAQRAAEEQRVQDAGRLTKAGAYGGSRQGIMESEGVRNLMTNLSDITGTGYANAYGDAQQQYNSEEARRLAQGNTNEERRLGQVNTDEINRLKQFNAQEDNKRSQFNLEADRNTDQLVQDRRYGLDVNQRQADLGATQRAIEAEGVLADKTQFEQERDFGSKQVQYLQSLLDGLPLDAKTTSYAGASGLSSLTGGIGGLAQLWELLNGGAAATPPAPGTTVGEIPGESGA